MEAWRELLAGGEMHCVPVLAAAALLFFLPCGCLQILGDKSPIPLQDAGDDADGVDMEADEHDFPTEADLEEPADIVEMVADEEPSEDAGDSDAEELHEEPDAAEIPPDLVWVSVPAGSFDMGCSTGDADCSVDESPRHTVWVSTFKMTETEITQSQYERVTGSNPSFNPDCPECPVEVVNWNEAKAFCEAIGGRFPSEAEWEYAARAGTATRYYCGDDTSCLEDIAWYSTNSASTTHPVKEKTANDFGLYDMLGNVWEWMEDCWHSDYSGAPSTGVVWGGGDCTYRVIRGGSWNHDARYLRASNREMAGSGDASGYYGFRCAQ